MTAKTVFMFSGQGSQYYQMGKQLFDENPVFRHWMTRMDAMAHAYCGRRVVEAIYGSVKGEAFDQVLFTHPAIFMVEYALAQCLIDAGIEPDLTLGVSMGSFAAAAVGGHIGLGDALQAVLAQALAFQRSCPPGGMLAVLAPPALYDEAFMCQHSTMAGANFDGHFAVAGAPEDLALIETELAARAVTYQSLAVRYAFHSPAIDAAAPLFDACMAARTRSQGHIPLVCSGHASTLTHLPEDFFWRVVRRPMRFRDTLRHLERQGPHRYIDVGPSGTLATFVKYGMGAESTSSSHALLTPYGHDRRNLEAMLAPAVALP